MNFMYKKNTLNFYKALDGILLNKIRKIKHKESIRKANKKYRETHKEKCKEINNTNMTNYRRNNREKVNEYYKNAYHTKKENEEWFKHKLEQSRISVRKFRETQKLKKQTLLMA